MNRNLASERKGYLFWRSQVRDFTGDRKPAETKLHTGWRFPAAGIELELWGQTYRKPAATKRDMPQPLLRAAETPQLSSMSFLQLPPSKGSVAICGWNVRSIPKREKKEGIRQL